MSIIDTATLTEAQMSEAIHGEDEVAPAPALSDRVLNMTTQDKIAYSAKLVAPWNASMLSLMDAYRKEYPPETTRVDVIQAVSVSIPLRAFTALLSAAQCVIISAGETEGEKQ